MQQNNLPEHADAIRDQINGNLDDIARIYDKEYGLEELNGKDEAARQYQVHARKKREKLQGDYFTWLVEENTVLNESRQQVTKKELPENKNVLTIAYNRIPSLPAARLEQALENKEHRASMWSKNKEAMLALIFEAMENEFFNPYQCNPEWYNCAGPNEIKWEMCLETNHPDRKRKQMRVA